MDSAKLTGSSRGTVFFNGGAIFGTAGLSSTVNSISTIGHAVGYAADNWLIYGTGGLAVTNEQSTLTGATFVCGGPARRAATAVYVEGQLPSRLRSGGECDPAFAEPERQG